MAEPRCGTCPFRARYDNNPRSILGRIWRWHINFCPGWKGYMRSLSDEEKKAIIEQYGLKAEKFM
jgi:hypothetical protein